MKRKMNLEPDVKKTKAFSQNNHVNKSTQSRKIDPKPSINRFLYSYPFQLKFHLRSIYKLVKQE